MVACAAMTGDGNYYHRHPRTSAPLGARCSGIQRKIYYLNIEPSAHFTLDPRCGSQSSRIEDDERNIDWTPNDGYDSASLRGEN